MMVRITFKKFKISLWFLDGDVDVMVIHDGKLLKKKALNGSSMDYESSKSNT